MLPPRPYVAFAAGALAVALVAGCSDDPSPTAASPSVSSAPSAPSAASSAPAAPVAPGGSVAVLLRDGEVDRERGFDQQIFDTELADACPTCTVVHRDAEGVYQNQTAQLAALVGSETDVVVIDPVNPLTVVTFVDQLRDYGTKVVVVGAPVEGADLRVAFDDEAVGTLQAQALLRAAGTRAPQLLAVNGSPDDAASTTVKTAVHAVLDRSRATIVGEYDDVTPRPGPLRTWLGTLLTYYPPSVVGGVYAADDRIAGEVVTALRAAGATSGAIPPVTGAGSDLDGVRRVLEGTQLMTVYRPLAPASERAADVVGALLGGTDPGYTVDVAGTATALLDPVAVTAGNVADTVVADGYWTAEDLCTKALARACRRAGLDAG